jgi:hypothetical protein
VEIRAYLNLKLQQSFSEEWDPERPTRFEVVDEGWVTGLRFFTRLRDGSWSLVHEEPPVPLATPEDVDDMLARGLSVFLMNHPGWPR